jgi:beta-galactosidase
MNKIFAAFLSAVLLLPFTGMSQDRSQVNKEDFFPFAVWYSGGKERATMLSDLTPEAKPQWKKDVDQIKALGFNTIKTWVEWSHCEPEKGKYNFENLRQILEFAQQDGLRVVIQVYAESAPEWLGRAFPDALFEAQNGDRIQPQVAPGYCVDNAGVRDAFVKFYQEAAKVAIGYSSFYGWDLWSEPHIVQWGSPRWIQDAQYCFCPYTQERFRVWLKNKYGSLDDLNKSWYRHFINWEEVEAPKFSTILTYADFMDWKSFIYNKMAGDLKLRYDAVRSVDKTHVATAHASPVSLFSSPYGSGAEDDFLMADQVDYYGLSQYPKHNQPGDWTPWRFMAGGDFSCSANKKNGGYYVGEFQAGYGTVGLNVGDPVTPDDQRIWALSSLATGAKGIFAYAYYPMSSGYESGGYGLVNLDGTQTERAVALGKLARRINANGKTFSESRPVKAQIALLYNPLSQMVGGSRRPNTVDGHSNSLIGYYRYLTEQNIPVDFIHRRDLESGDLSQYKLIIVPYALMFNKKAADGLKAFIRNGGYAYSEARFAWNDEHGNTSDVIPGLGMSEVFGVRETKVQTLKEVKIQVPDNSQAPMQYLKKDDSLTGSLFAESLAPLHNAKVLATLDDGSAAIVTSTYGKGHTMYVGSFLAMANSRGSLWDQSTEQRIVTQDRSNRNTNDFLLGLVDWAHVMRPFTVVQQEKEKTANPLIVRLHDIPEGYLLYVLNLGRSMERATIRINVPEDGTYSLEELMQHKTLTASSKNKVLEITTADITVKNGEVWKLTRIKR